MKTTPFNRVKYGQEWIKKHHSWERTQYRNFKSALDTQFKPVVDYIKLHGVSELRKHLSILISEQPISKAYKKCYVDVGVDSAKWTYKQIQSMAERKAFDEIEIKSIPGYFAEKWRKLMSFFYETEAGERITSVTDTSKERIGRLLDEADEKNLTLEEKATYLVDNIEDKDFNRSKALVIARTETTTGANKGASIANESADYLTQKQWLAILDANTRPTHVDADGQIVMNDEKFIVGGESCMYPGDPVLSAKEAIQCRCVAVYTPVLSGNGLPILK